MSLVNAQTLLHLLRQVPHRPFIIGLTFLVSASFPSYATAEAAQAAQVKKDGEVSPGPSKKLSKSATKKPAGKVVGKAAKKTSPRKLLVKSKGKSKAQDLLKPTVAAALKPAAQPAEKMPENPGIHLTESPEQIQTDSSVAEANSKLEPAAKAEVQRKPGVPGNHDAYFGKTVGAIHISGLKRIEKDAVLAKIGTKPGELLSGEQVRDDIQALFGMGHFDDVSVSGEMMTEDRVEVVYVVRERPAISKVEFEGNERISTSDLKEVIKVKDWSILDVNKVREDVALLQKHYEDKGFYLAKVTYDVKAVKADEVELVYRINDYDKIQIKKITFLNNKEYSDEQLKSVLGETREGGFFSFISGSGNFKESAFKQDLQRLTYWYLDHGFVKFKYENPVITVSEDKKWLYISLYVDEGSKYQIGNVDFGGDLLFNKEELDEDISMPTGETFSISKRNADIQKLTEKYQDLGYAFVNVIPKMNIHDDTKLIDIEYDFEKGDLVYFGEINIVGNTKTFDKVIRRELRIQEGTLYSGSKLRISKENVERLGYFAPGEVIFNTVSPKGKSGILDVEISIKERSTGTITLGAGYGSYQGFFFTTQIAEINLLGRGQNLSLSAQYSIQQLQQSFNLGFTEPYTLDSLWTTGFDLYAVKFPIPYRWITSKLGFDVRFGHPIYDYTYGYITYKLEGLKDLNPDPAIPQNIIDEDTGVLSSIVWSVIRDKRNNRFETTSGNYQSASLETAGLGGDLSFIKWSVNNRFYKRIWGDLVFRNSTEIGQISSLFGSGVPTSQKFYLGGPNNMKGYQLFLLGPLGTNSRGEPMPLGGTNEAFTLFELEYPILKEAGIKAVLFFDAGNTWDRWPMTLQTDAGFGFRWFSPIGPLRFEWGFPLNPRDKDQSSVFQFFIGPPF